MFATFGDMASAFHSRTMSARLKSDMSRLGVELTTGIKTNIGAAVSGDFGPIAGIEHSLKTLESYKVATNEASTVASAMQHSLGAIQTQSQELSAGLLTATTSRGATLIKATAHDAEQKFLATVSQLNTNVMGRSLFSGAATDRPALAKGEDMLAALKVEIAGETTAAGVSARIDAWFDDPGGGFETVGYLGSDNPAGPIRLGNGETAELDMQADNQEIRDVLKAIAKSAVMADGALDGRIDEQLLLTKAAGEGLLTANDSFTLARANVGALEARIENVSTRNEAEKSALEISRNELIAADPYDTATELQAAYGQLESLYTVTARMSQLKFTDYMR